MLNTILPSTSGIYEIRNTINNKVYVGSAVNLKKRWRNHQNDLKNGDHHSIKLQNAWNKYKADAFVFSVLEDVIEKTLLQEIEQKWMDIFESYSENGYNVQIKAYQGCLGMTIPAHIRKKTSETMKGRTYSKSRIDKASLALMGRKLSDEHIDKLRNKKLSPEHKEKLRIANTGRKPSEKQMAALAERNSVRVISIEQRKQISEKLKGRKVSEEALKNMTGRIASEITRKKMTDAQKLRWEKVRINAAKQNTV